MDKAEAKTAALFLILSVAYFTQRKGDKQDAMAMEAERKEDAKAMEARMDKAETRMQENFRLSTFLTIVSLFLSLAANERFVANLFPQR
jgi:hypothetical protein